MRIISTSLFFMVSGKSFIFVPIEKIKSMATLFIIGIFLSFFFMTLLLSKKQKSIPDKILAVWMCFIGIHLLSYYLYSLGFWVKYPHLIGVTHPFPLIHGVMLYLYTFYSLPFCQKFRTRDLLHFLPFVLMYIYMIPTFLFSYSAEQKRVSDELGVDSEFQPFFIVSAIAFIISGIVYPILSYKLTQRYRKTINQYFAYLLRINLKWLQFFILSIFVVYISGAFFGTLHYVMRIPFVFNIDYVAFFLFISFLIFLGYFGIRQEGVFSNQSSLENIGLSKIKKEYLNSGLKKEDAKILLQKLKQHMQTEKPYLNPKLSLGNLSQQLNVSANYLSQAINQYENKNFYDFVNEYRVNEFIARASMPENKKFNILSIAYDAGFNSKSSFNQIFKKKTTKTPSQFIRENKLN